MSAELDRLQKVYAQYGDGQLLDLGSRPDDLTADAQAALGEELKRRGLTAMVHRGTPISPSAAGLATVAEEGPERSDGFGVGVPGMFPGAAMAVEQALEPGGEVRMGMIGLATFYDGLELSRACEALEDADIEPAIEEIAGDPTVGTAPRFEVWVPAAAFEKGKFVLRAKMGLFPLPEVDALEDGDGDAESAAHVIGQFETLTEAEQVRAMLEQAGFAAAVEDDAEGMATVTVDADHYDAALAVVAEKMGLE